MRILLVEDDDDLRDIVAEGLRQDSLAVDVASSIAEATECCLVTAYDVVCLDLGLPDGDGMNLCHQLVQGSLLQRPNRLLILTARDAVTDRVAGLDAGADDYLVKPFKIAELSARIRALGRRRDQHGSVLHVGDLVVDLSRHQAERSGRTLELTGREFAVLHHFCANAGQVVTAEELLERCWDAHADPLTGSVRVIMSRLRSKLGDPPLIETIKGVGYRLQTS